MVARSPVVAARINGCGDHTEMESVTAEKSELVPVQGSKRVIFICTQPQELEN